MNGIYVESNGTNTYLVYKLSENEEIDTLSLGMMVNNKISNVIPILFTQLDSDKYFKYNISSKISLKQYFSGMVNKKRLLTVFSSVLKAIIQSTEYMIDASSFILDPEYIYVDVSSGEAYLLCMPLMELADKRVELSAFFKSIMFSTQFDQNENVDYVAMLISYINSNPTISPEGFDEFINELLNGPRPIKKEEKPSPQVNTDASQAVASNAVQHSAGYSGMKTPLTKEQMPQSFNEKAPAPAQTPNRPVNNTPVNAPAHNNKKDQLPLKNDKQGREAKNVQTGFAVPGKSANVSQPVPAEKPKKEKKGGFSLFGKKKEKNPEQNNKQQTPVNNNSGFNVPGQNVQVTSTNVSIPNIPQNNEPAPNHSGPKMNFGDTTVLGGNAPIGETTVLGMGAPTAPRQAFLVRKKNNERIVINKDMFKLGKERSYVDYCVSDNSAVSRSHANIIKKGSDYFVVDMNSTNHSFINGMILTPQTESKINNGDTLSLGDEEFVFHI